MRYYVTFDENGKLRGYMEYEHLNATMQEVTEEEYRDIMQKNGISYEPIPDPNPSPTLEERITEQEAKQLRTDTALAELSILIANVIAPSAE